MRVSDTRYARERSQLELALQMIAYEARTHTIRDCTGLSDDRIRKLYSTYFKTHNGTLVRRQRGKSPTRVDVFFRSATAQMEATTLALLLVHFGLLAVSVDGAITRTLSNNGVRFGRRFCRAFSMFQALCPDSLLSFERAWSMCLALTDGDELTLRRCAQCDGSYVHDALSIAPDLCACCRIRRDTPDG